MSAGTGASCIYPLLGATMNGWYFLATEVDDICFNYATKNVEQNSLSDLIKGVRPTLCVFGCVLHHESGCIIQLLTHLVGQGAMIGLILRE